MVLRRHHFADDELQLVKNEPGEPPSCVISAHRARIHVDHGSATFDVRGTRWRGARADFVSAGAFLSAFEEALHRALTGA